jgi:hypothetical protein
MYVSYIVDKKEALASLCLLFCVLQLLWEAHQQSFPVFKPFPRDGWENIPHPEAPTQPQLATHRDELFLEKVKTQF